DHHRRSSDDCVQSTNHNLVLWLKDIASFCGHFLSFAMVYEEPYQVKQTGKPADNPNDMYGFGDEVDHGTHGLLGESILNQIGPHLGGLKALVRWIVVDGFIFPAVPDIRFITVKANQPTLINQSETLGRFTVVFMDFG